MLRRVERLRRDKPRDWAKFMSKAGRRWITKGEERSERDEIKSANLRQRKVINIRYRKEMEGGSLEIGDVSGEMEGRGQPPSPRLRRPMEDRSQKFATANPSFGGSEVREDAISQLRSSNLTEL